MLRIMHTLILRKKLLIEIQNLKFIGTFYEKELQKANQQEFRIGKVIKRHVDKLYVKWKGYDNSLD